MQSSTKPSASAAAGSDAGNQQPVLIQEYSLRVPKGNLKPISIMRFNAALDVDPSKWTSAKMQREDNSKLHKTLNFHDPEDTPKFGAGSEYGREAREEARRRKYGMHKKKYRAEDQPWILKLGDKINRKFKGVREGGVSENAAYYIFTQGPDKTFEVFPVQQWYNFTPIQRYKSLTAEEAEEEFGRRNKIMNYFSLMVNKRMKSEEEGADDAEASSNKKKGDFKVSEMDEWSVMGDDVSESSSDEDSSQKTPKKKGKLQAATKKKKKKKVESDEEAIEDSDDGDEEGRELDYISDSTESESEGEAEKKGALVGVDQEVESASESEDEENEEKNKKEGNAASPENESEAPEKKKKKKKKGKKDQPNHVGSDNEEDGDMKGTEDSTDSRMEVDSPSKESENSRDGMSESDSSIGAKRKLTDYSSDFGASSKKAKMEVPLALLQQASNEGITEEAVRRYLMRKPMTVTDLLQKFKKTKIASHDMVNVIASILRKINPSKFKRNQSQKMYLFIKNRE